MSSGSEIVRVTFCATSRSLLPSEIAAFVVQSLLMGSAIVCGRPQARLASAGTPIGTCDLLIAAIALANNLILVTHNTREFERVDVAG